MGYQDYICDDCGFSSEEKPGVYKCPKCGNKMRIAKVTGYGGDSTVGFGKWLWYIIIIILIYPICFATLGFLIGTIVFILIFLLVRHYLNRSVKDKAIRINETQKPLLSDSNFCDNCGHKLTNSAKFCPNCGKSIGK